MEKLLSDICKIQYGYAFDSAKFSTDKENGMPLVRIRDVLRGFSETYTTEECSKEYIVQNGDILIGMDGEFNIAQWKGGTAYLNQRVCRLIPSIEINALYLFYFMKKALKAIEDKTPFVTVKHLSAKELNKIIVHIPPMEEQKRIADSIKKTEEIIGIRKKQLQLLDDLVKARFVEMFGDILSDNKLPLVQLKELADIGSSKRIYANEYVDSGIPFYRSKEIRELGAGLKPSVELFIKQERYGEIKEKYGVPKIGDILIAAIGATIGYSWIVDTDKPFYYKDGNLIILSTKNNVNPIFLNHTIGILIEDFKSKGVAGSAQLALTIEKLEKMQVVNPNIELQNKFAAFVEQTNKSKVVVQKAIDEAQSLFNSLMQEYFG
ncbi:MAG: restriction endonuclease subunit S [Clostridia bacterium]|nr:restriction endonuclease subunit S [Clostridia bacterium]